MRNDLVHNDEGRPFGATLVNGADDEIRTRDPHLGKAMDIVRSRPCRPLPLVGRVAPSAQSAEFRPIRQFWFNALNLCGSPKLCDSERSRVHLQMPCGARAEPPQRR